MKVYLAGPMRGYPLHNFPAFEKATVRLRELGHEVFSPAEHALGNGFNPLTMTGLTIRNAMAADLTWVCLHAETVITLDGWQQSKGATAEVRAAEAIGIPVHEFEGFRW